MGIKPLNLYHTQVVARQILTDTAPLPSYRLDIED